MTAPKIDALYLKNFKSVGNDTVRLSFPRSGPVVLLGENNAGKSNIGRGLEILLGERWPKSYQPDDHDFHGRSADGVDIKLGAMVSGLECPQCSGRAVRYFRWEYDRQNDGDPCTYSYTCAGSCDGNIFVRNTLRQQLAVLLIGADRRLSYQLSYTSRFTLLSKLMHRFHSKLVNNPERVRQLRQIFEETVRKFSEVEEFATFRDLLRTTSGEFGQNLAYQLDVDFSAYDPSNFFRSLRLHPKLDNDVRTFDELGTGQEQILALAFAYSYAKAFSGEAGLILAVDEPESNLHPIAQQWLASKLQEMVSDGLQILLTTHSPHFVDLANPETLALVRKSGPDGATSITQVTKDQLVARLIERGANPDRTSAATVGPFYAAGATAEIKAGLFSRACIIVEGDTEAMALPGLFRTFGFDILRLGFAIVAVGGVSNIAKWQRLYSIYGIPTFPLFDTDSDKTGDKDKERERDRRDLLTALGCDPDEAVGLQGDAIVAKELYGCFDANFESAMVRIAPERWAELTAESRELVGSSKPLQARYVTERLSRNDITESGRALVESLVAKVRVQLEA